MAKEDAPAVIIPERHQSAPKEHYADKAIKQAAEEIDTGKWQPPAEVGEQLEHLPNVALRTGTTEMLEKRPTRADFAHTENSLVLAEHPRVKDAMERLQREQDDAPNSQEYFEKAAMLHELNVMKNLGNRWEGQERWQGKDNIEARRGMVLTPLQFYVQLMKTVNPKAQFAHHLFQTSTGHMRAIGVHPIYLGREAVLDKPNDPGASSGRVPLVVLASEKIQVLTPGAAPRTDEAMLVATLQWPAGTEWMIMNFDEFNVPTTAKFIGWRTALLSMIRSGVITEKQANAAFPLKDSEPASWYRQQMKEWRHAHRGRHA